MNLRADHVAGAFFVAFGLLVIALSGDLPFGGLSMPGAGFMPLLVAVLIIVFGASLFLRARESKPFCRHRLGRRQARRRRSWSSPPPRSRFM